MADEPILIIDDTPVNLKLTRILLVNEGFTVMTASSAEEAIELLKSSHPSLILADVQLPGMNGLELTRLLKQDPETADILIVALTAYAMKGDEQRAMEAGCDGYITKPIDTRTLGPRLREYLNRRSHPAPGATPERRRAVSLAPAGAEPDMAALRKAFLADGLQQSRGMRAATEGIFDPNDFVVPVHQWAGTAGLLGYSALGRLARGVEGLLRDRPINQALLREQLDNLVAAFSNPSEARDIPIPDYVLEALSGKHVALVGLPGAEQDRMAAAIERANAITEIYDSPGVNIPDALLQCALAVIHVRRLSPVTVWLAGDSRLWNVCPVVLTGAREDLLALPQVAQSRAREFLMDSWQPDEALVRLGLALSRQPAVVSRPSGQPAPARPRVLVADDDPTVVALVRTSLTNFGMECETVADGPSALAAIRAMRPHAAVLDVNMPGMDGYAVLSAIRSDEIPIRVMLLTARQQEADILRAFTIGADDYVIKPFSPMELVARLKRLLGR